MKLPPIYPIVDDTLLATRGMSLIGAAEALLEEGARILQVRRKEHFGRIAFEECEQIATLCSAAGALLVINDRADIAKLLGAGLHIGQQDLPSVAARGIMGGDAVIGLSTHNRTQFDAGEAEPVDYLALGPIFATSNKIDPDPVVGTEKLGRLRSRTVKPIVAIGGVTRANAHQAWRAGADSVAVIGDLYPEPCTRTSIMERFREWKRLAGE
jgi:thiamine-phosphate pyrophosphorylase